ncbi:MAG: GH116 family glycosyl hydrolase [Bacteroidota bacterium]
MEIAFAQESAEIAHEKKTFYVWTVRPIVALIPSIDILTHASRFSAPTMKSLTHALLLLNSAAIVAIAASKSPPAPSVGYLVVPGALTHEDSAALAWLRSEPGLRGRIVTPARLRDPGVDLVWIHVTDSLAYLRWLPEMEKLRPLATFYRAGGGLLLTGFAAMVPSMIGMETERPEILPLRITNDGPFDQKGHQGYRGHPVFDGFFGGVFTWDSNADQVVHRVGYFGNRYPREGKVVGIEKSYVVLESDNKLIVEHNVGKGRSMSIGAYVVFGGTNAKDRHLRKFITNTIRYLVKGGSARSTSYWTPDANRPAPFAVKTSPLVRARSYEISAFPEGELHLRRDPATDQFYDLAGRRTLVMGKEKGGIDELWVHPFRVLRNYQAGLILGDSIRWLEDIPCPIDVRPESITRTYRTPVGTIRETVIACLEKPGALIQYALEEPRGSVPLVVRYRCDLRWMWPYDERALGSVYYGYDEALHALHVRDRSGDFYCIIGADRRPEKRLAGAFDRVQWKGGDLIGEPTTLNQVVGASVYELGPADASHLTCAIVGTDEGRAHAMGAYRGMLLQPRSEVGRLVRHYHDLLARTVTIASPDTAFDRMWKWTLVGVDRFIAHTPRLGTALLAGFSTVDRGWDGGQKISGRPGYAWYFGRDAEWAGFAIDDYGDFPTVRQQLEFLQEYQDISGKILHELSTSGVVHYDAADATPLYVVLAAHYLRASGDTTFLRASWPHIRKAMEFLYTTDSDGDLLIENTDVGHGWVEGGKLWPVHTEFYLAGIWGQALSDAAWMASLLKHHRLAERYGRDGAIVKKKVDTEFWNPSTGFYSYGKLQDGSYNPEPTILPAAVMYFGWLDEAKVTGPLTMYARNSFTVDWGTRIVSEESPLFDPRGYHYGAVWPLFTGWTALAEYAYGRSTQAFAHLASNMDLENHWALGFVPEVLNGSIYTPGGVCPHQCWSETNVLHPGIHGMIGWQPRATEHAATLAPRFPLNWDRVSVRNLRVGRSVMDMRVERFDHITAYRLVLREGPPVTIDLAPDLPDGMEITVIAVNGRGIKHSTERGRGILKEPVSVVVRDSAEVRFSHAGGIGVLPLVPHPAQGDSSHGARILNASLHGLKYTIDLEGRSGTSAQFEVLALDQNVNSVEGGALLLRRPDGSSVLTVRFEPSARRWAKKRVVVELQEIWR